jgi:hypothetical protein
VTPEKLAAYEDARRYVQNMTALGWTVPDRETEWGFRKEHEPITYPVPDQLTAERSVAARLTTHRALHRTGLP